MIRIYCLKKLKEKKSFFKRIYTGRRKPRSAEAPPPPRPLTSLQAGSMPGHQPAVHWRALFHQCIPICGTHCGWNFSVTIVLHFLFTACSVQTGN